MQHQGGLLLLLEEGAEELAEDAGEVLLAASRIG
jgi:hypothetical protein